MIDLSTLTFSELWKLYYAVGFELLFRPQMLVMIGVVGVVLFGCIWVLLRHGGKE
jgi:hypothetical protein